MSANVPLRRRPRITAPETPMATIVVAADSPEDARRYTVHESFLVHYSPFFKAALQGRFAEAESKIVTVENIDPTDVENFIFWIYHQRFPDRDIDDLHTADHWGLPDDHGVKQMFRMISLYIFCDKYDVPDLKKNLVDELFNHLENPDVFLPHELSVKAAFEKLPDNDPLRKFLVDVHFPFADPGTWTKHEAIDYPWTFVTRVLARNADLDVYEELERCE